MPTRERRLAELARIAPEDGAADTVLLPLELTPAAVEAIETLQEVLQANDALYRVLRAQLARWQGRLDGPLTDTLAALVGKEA